MNKLSSNSQEPRFIFIAGTPRSGGNVTLGSLDGHPDILAWPYEFTYFAFFQRIAGDRNEVPASELNKELINKSFQSFSKRLEHGGSIYDSDDSKAAIRESYNIGDLDYQAFLKGVNSINDRKVGSVEYLRHLFKCLKQANRSYRDKDVKYYLLLTTARSFGWKDEELIGGSMILYSYREAEESYSSLREKYVTTHGMKAFLNPNGKKSILYWLENYRRISKSAEKRSSTLGAALISEAAPVASKAMSGSIKIILTPMPSSSASRLASIKY